MRAVERAFLLWQVLVACRISLAVPSDGPTFSIVQTSYGTNACCRTQFFESILDAVKRHPSYRIDPADADVLIPAIDTLRQCFSLQAVEFPACVPQDSSAASRRLRISGFSTADTPWCDWCCRGGADEFVATARQALLDYGLNKSFVYFGNNQDTAYECREFLYAKVALAKLPVTVHLAGINLQVSRLTRPETARDRNRYPIPGINLLVPLHPSHGNMVLDDASRESCTDFDQRDLLASFSGHMDPEGLRGKVFGLKDMPGTERFLLYETGGFGQGLQTMGYEEMLRRSVFAYVPRGDEHYSFRLTEVLAAGAVPLLIDDDYQPPFGMPDISDWAVKIPENDIGSSVAIINGFSRDQICSFQKNGSRIWSMSRDIDGMVAGLADGLRRVRSL